MPAEHHVHTATKNEGAEMKKNTIIHKYLKTTHTTQTVVIARPLHC